MMDEHIDVSLTRIENCIQALQKDEFTTAKVIRKYFGGCSSNLETPAVSINAQFGKLLNRIGKLLNRNETRLRITEIASNESIEYDHGHPTKTSLWRVSM